MADWDYGFLQLIWFVWRWLNGLVGRTVGREKTWFPAGKICSELVSDYFTHFPAYAQALAAEDYSENTCAPEDLYQMVIKNPSLFTLIEGK